MTMSLFHCQVWMMLKIIWFSSLSVSDNRNASVLFSSRGWQQHTRGMLKLRTSDLNLIVKQICFDSCQKFSSKSVFALKAWAINYFACLMPWKQTLIATSLCLQGNGCRLSIHLELLNSVGRVASSSLHHHSSLLLSKSSSLSSKSSLLRWQLTCRHASAAPSAALSPSWHTIRSCCSCWQLHSSGERPGNKN